MNLIFTSIPTLGIGKTLGPYVLATALRKNNIPVQVVEHFDKLNLEQVQQIADKYITSNSLFIGFSSSFFSNMKNYFAKRSKESISNFPHDNDYMKSFFEIFKSKNSNLKFLYGGTNAGTLNTLPDGIDFVVKGYAESLICQLVKKPELMKRIYGNIIDTRDSRVKPGPVIWQQEDSITPNEHLPLETSRGCVYKCCFCHNKPPYSRKSLKNLDYELRRNYDKFGIKNYYIVDLLFSGKKCLDVFANLPFDVTFTNFARLENLMTDPESYVDLLLRAGCKGLLFGMESLNPVTLKFIDKGPHPDKQIEFLRFLKEKTGNKINLTASFICGLPYDNFKDVEKWLEFLQSDANPLDNHYIQPLMIPGRTGSPIADDKEKWGYELLPDGWKCLTSDVTQKEAELFVKSISQEGVLQPISPKISRKIMPIKVKPFFGFINRICNLGFDYDEVSKMEDFLADDMTKIYQKRKEKIIKEYFNKLLR